MDVECLLSPNHSVRESVTPKASLKLSDPRGEKAWMQTPLKFIFREGKITQVGGGGRAHFISGAVKSDHEDVSLRVT